LLEANLERLGEQRFEILSDGAERDCEAADRFDGIFKPHSGDYTTIPGVRENYFASYRLPATVIIRIAVISIVVSVTRVITIIIAVAAAMIMIVIDVGVAAREC
jgi:hypothetical protein